MSEQSCSACGGLGYLPDACDACGGSGITTPEPAEKDKLTLEFTWICARCKTLNGLHREGCRECGLSIYRSQAAESTDSVALDESRRTAAMLSEALEQRDTLKSALRDLCDAVKNRLSDDPTPETRLQLWEIWRKCVDIVKGGGTATRHQHHEKLHRSGC